MDKRWKKIGIGLICVAVLGGTGVTIATLNQPKTPDTHTSSKKRTNDGIIGRSKAKEPKKSIDQAKGTKEKEEKQTIAGVSGNQESSPALAPVSGNTWRPIDRSPIVKTLAALDKQIEQKKVGDKQQKEVPKVPSLPVTPVFPPQPTPPQPKPDETPKPQPKPNPLPEPQPIPPVVTVVDYRVLHQLVHVANQVASAEYTPNSYQVLANERAIAVQMLQTQTATQEQVNTEVVRLQAAIDQLVRKADKHVLAEWVATGNGIDRSLYTTTSVDVLDQALTQAQAILADENSSQSIVDTAAVQLQKAVDQLVKRGDKSPLHALVMQANAIDRELYTDASVAVLDQAVVVSKDVLNNEDATEDDVAQACQKVQTGIDQLKKKEDPAYTVALIKRLLKECEALNAEEYTATSYRALKAEMDKAHALVARPDATTKEAEAQLEALQKAKDALVKKAHKEALQALVNEVKALNPSDYTTDSWSAVATALTKAEQVLTDENATQIQIDRAKTLLDQAKNKLVEKES